MKVNINNASDNSKAAIPVNLLFTKARTKRNNAIRKGNIEIANSKIDNSVAANFHWSIIMLINDEMLRVRRKDPQELIILMIFWGTN